MSNNVRGVLWALLVTALFASGAAMSKHAALQYHVLQILFFRQVFIFLAAMPVLVRDFPRSLRTSRPGLQAVRLVAAFIALSMGIWSVTVLPLSTAITLGFAQVFFVSLIALWFLGEKVGPHRIGAVMVGFIGVVIAMRPGIDGLINPHSLIPVCGALGAAVAICCVRRLSQTDSTATLLMFQAVFVGGLAGVAMIWFWKTPDLPGFVFFGALGLLAAVAQWAGVHSLRLGEASVVGNIEYMKLIYATALGYLFFKEVPDGYTLVGAVTIVASSAYIFHREARARRTER